MRKGETPSPRSTSRGLVLVHNRCLQNAHVQVPSVLPGRCRLQGDGGDQAQGAVAVGEDSDRPDPPFDLSVQPLQAEFFIPPARNLLVDLITGAALRLDRLAMFFSTMF